jgi:hypothetical protein
LLVLVLLQALQPVWHCHLQKKIFFDLVAAVSDLRLFH